jgi:hypothetical protein
MTPADAAPASSLAGNVLRACAAIAADAFRRKI